MKRFMQFFPEKKTFAKNKFVGEKKPLIVGRAASLALGPPRATQIKPEYIRNVTPTTTLTFDKEDRFFKTDF